jgi:flagellar basal-body rod protein FlgB
MIADDLPLFTMLKGRLSHLSQRQRVIGQNVANADTPGYAARDVKAFTFAVALKAMGGDGVVGTARTNAAHLQGNAPKASGPSAVWSSKVRPDSETTLDGNSVVLEEQMIKMAESRADYDAAVGFYQKSLSLIRMAARRPGG